MNPNAQNSPRMTAEEYLQTTTETDAFTELIDGEIVNLASPSRQHQRISGRMFSAFDRFILANGGSCEVYQTIDVQLNDKTVVSPDLCVICSPEKRNLHGCTGAPDFICEIVSTNRSDDYVRKLYLYQISGVREYWIVDPFHERTLVYFFEQGKFPEIYTFDAPIPIGIYGGALTVRIADFL